MTGQDAVLTVQQVLAIVQAGELIVGCLITTVEGFRAWLRALQPSLSDADLNAICEAVRAGAQRHKALAQGDAGETA